MATIYKATKLNPITGKREDYGNWLIAIVQTNGKRVVTSSKTTIWKDARKLASKLEGDVADGKPITVGRKSAYTFTDATETLLASYRAESAPRIVIGTLRSSTPTADAATSSTVTDQAGKKDGMRSR